MAAKKKGKVGGLDGLIQSVQAAAKTKTAIGAASTLTKISDQSANWKWVDFVDPRTGYPVLAIEYLFGTRGLLCGRMYKIEAMESVGKSAFCYFMYGAGQRTCDATCLHMESENATPTDDYVASFGCDPARILEARPGSLGRALYLSEELVNNAKQVPAKSEDPNDLLDKPILLSWDSVSGFSSDEDLEGAATESSNAGGLGYHSRKIGEFFRDFGWWLSERDVALIATAQLRDKIETGGPFSRGRGGPSGLHDNDPTTIAAKPLNYHATGRLQMSAKSLWEPKSPGAAEMVNNGVLVTFRLVKNKLGWAYRKIPPVAMRRDQGFDFTMQTYDFLKEGSPWFTESGEAIVSIETRGSWYVCEKYGIKGQGEDTKRAIMDAILTDHETVMKLREVLRIRGYGFAFEKKYTLDRFESGQVAEPV